MIMKSVPQTPLLSVGHEAEWAEINREELRASSSGQYGYDARGTARSRAKTLPAGGVAARCLNKGRSCPKTSSLVLIYPALSQTPT